jgi:hypothetical protein
MKSRKGKHGQARQSPAGDERYRQRQIVPLDQGPIRRKAASECGREMARLEKARVEWKRFEQEDKPAFERWMAATFGPLLSSLRETESLVREKDALIHEVEAEMYLGGAGSHRAAYAAVMRRRASPPPAFDPRADEPQQRTGEDDDDAGFEDFRRGEIPEFEQNMLFEDFLRMVLGINPDRLSDRKYEAMFADFKAKILGQGGPEPRSPEHVVGPAQPEQARIKEIYRVLVRRLHPDTRADEDTEISALWHEVQEAYSTGNVGRLEMLLALTDIRSNAVGEHTSLFQMRSVLRELRRSFNALQRSLRGAKKDPAWNFARTADRASVGARLQRRLESDLAMQKARLCELDALISRWSAPPKPKRRKPAENQTDLPF